MKKLISIVMAVIMMTVTATGAFAAPTNSVPFTNSPVHGGASQELCQKACTDVSYCQLDIASLNLNGQTKISFRPYYQTYKLCVYATNVTASVVYNVVYDHNTSYIKTGRLIKMKGSIPSTSTSDEAYFSGVFKF